MDGVMLAEGVIFKGVTFQRMQILVGSGVPYRFEDCRFVDCTFGVVGEVANAFNALIEMTAVTGIDALRSLLDGVVAEAERLGGQASKPGDDHGEADAGRAGA